MGKPDDALIAALRKIIEMAPDEEPDEEDYDDTESAFNLGLDTGAWEAAEVAVAALKSAGIEP